MSISPSVCVYFLPQSVVSICPCTHSFSLSLSWTLYGTFLAIEKQRESWNGHFSLPVSEWFGAKISQQLLVWLSRARSSFTIRTIIGLTLFMLYSVSRNHVFQTFPISLFCAQMDETRVCNTHRSETHRKEPKHRSMGSTLALLTNMVYKVF